MTYAPNRDYTQVAIPLIILVYDLPVVGLRITLDKCT
jgi:hypothetical protein